MIAFFRGNFPSRLIGLLILFFLLRVPLLLSGVPLTLADLHHLLLGGRMSDGFALYREIYDPVAPLSALVFWLIDLARGRSAGMYTALGTLLVLFQALRLNAILNRNKVHPEKSFIPGLLYLVCASLFFEFDRLSPVLMGVTFLILALSYFTTFSEGADNSSKLFKGGLMLGLGALFYLPLLWYLLLGVFAIIFFSSDTFRNILLLLVSFLFPFAVAGTYYLYTDALEPFFSYHVLQAALIGSGRLLPVHDSLMLLAPMLLVLLAAFFRLYAESTSLNYRVRFQQLMVLWLVVSVPVIMSGGPVSVRSYAVLLPAVAYFSVQAFSLKKPVWISETLFALILLGVIWSRYGQFLLPAGLYRIDTSDLVVTKNPYPGIRNKKVLVLGNDQRILQENTPATAYLHWPSVRRDFRKLDTYQAIYRIDNNLAADMPEVIIDQEKVMPKLLYHLPHLGAKFEAVKGKNVWVRKENQGLLD